MAKRVNWYYHRTGCETCAKSLAFLTRHGVTPAEQVSAVHKFGPTEALRMARAAGRVVAVRGRSVVTFDMKKDPPDDDALLSKLIGPTGNLRAPVLRVGTTLVVGFSEEAYADALETS
jgi:arsenate reductase-like glutaredoxin family protein